MIGAYWGELAWKEFKGAPKGTNGLVAEMFYFCIGGLVMWDLPKLNS